MGCSKLKTYVILVLCLFLQAHASDKQNALFPRTAFPQPSISAAPTPHPSPSPIEPPIEAPPHIHPLKLHLSSPDFARLTQQPIGRHSTDDIYRLLTGMQEQLKALITKDITRDKEMAYLAQKLELIQASPLLTEEGLRRELTSMMLIITNHTTETERRLIDNLHAMARLSEQARHATSALIHKKTAEIKKQMSRSASRTFRVIPIMDDPTDDDLIDDDDPNEDDPHEYSSSSAASEDDKDDVTFFPQRGQKRPRNYPIAHETTSESTQATASSSSSSSILSMATPHTTSSTAPHKTALSLELDKISKRLRNKSTETQLQMINNFMERLDRMHITARDPIWHRAQLKKTAILFAQSKQGLCSKNRAIECFNSIRESMTYGPCKGRYRKLKDELFAPNAQTHAKRQRK